MFQVQLPVPPSTNNLFTSFADRGGVHRKKTKEYMGWIKAAGWMLNIQRPQPIKGRVNVSIMAPRNNRRDLDNHVKALLDLLVGHSLIEDDRKIERLDICWHENGPDAIVHCRAAA